MDTLEFLQTVLPEDGIKYLALIDPKTGRPAHKPYENLIDMAKAVEEYDAKPVQVYHACGAYKEPFVEVDGKKRWRVKENQFKAKAFWLDVDCGLVKSEKGEGYPTKKDALVAIKQLCGKTGLPAPLIIDSGNGLHIYWPLTKAISSSTWIKIANRFKAVTIHLGLIADPTATADFARVLRPVGSTNKKKELKTVVAKNSVEAITPEKFVEALKSVDLPKQEPQKKVDINDDLIAHAPVSVPSFAEVISEKCAQVGVMRDTLGDVNYEHWRGVIGIIKHCEEGIEKAREWSAKRAETGHDQVDVDQKYDTWSSPPTTCEFFSKCNPVGCEGCQFSGKIKSPIVLGRKEPEPKAIEVEAKVDGMQLQVVVPEFPQGYGYSNNAMTRYMKDKDGITHSFAFCHNLFYPIHRIRKEDGVF
jgi:hypothetical protein